MVYHMHVSLFVCLLMSVSVYYLTFLFCFDNAPVNHDLFGLADAVRTVHGLDIYLRVPVTVE